MDFNQNGVFDGGEYASANVLNGASNPQSDLVFSITTGFSVGSTILRLRLSSDNTLSSSTPSGVAVDGEVEDFVVTTSEPTGCVEICNNGLDDDRDGLTDCFDCEDCVSEGSCNDNDGDGISDFCDLDDDNDGIPDMEECQEYINLNFEDASVTLNGSAISSISDVFPNDTLLFTNVGTLVDGTVLDSRIVINTVTSAAEYDPLREIISLTPYNPSNDDYLTFSVAVLESGTTTTIDFLGQIIFKDIDSQGGTDFTEVIGFQNSFQVNLGANLELLSYQNGGGATGYINYGLNPATAGSVSDWTDETNRADSEVDHWITAAFGGGSKIEVSFGVTGTSGNSSGARDLFLSDMYLLDRCDCDNDGIANVYDLDSDNDGIFDVEEAGHTAVDTNDDGIIDGVNALFGTNGLFDALETTADSDTLNYSVFDSEVTPDGIYDVCELDSDGDGCFDAEEEGVLDPDDDGLAGTGTPTVNTEGLVDSITYISPPNDNWQNPLIGSCLPEICGDGLDNDGDGDTDCADSDCINSLTINLSASSACVNETISISSSNLGSGTTYNWDFGTNASPATASGIGPHSVSYVSCGSKTISLTVLKNTCSLSVDSIVLIQDNTDPVWTTDPQDLILECSPSANYSDSISLWLANDGGGIATDNCSNFIISNNYSGLSPDCGATANATVQFTASDSCGNSAVRSALIQIRDTNGPTIQTIGDTLVNCNEIPIAPTPAIHDSCDVSPVLTFQEVLIQHPGSNWKSSSSCSMLYEITDGWYDNKGTGAVADDEMSFTITVIGQQVSSGWSTSLNGNVLSGSFYTSTFTGTFLSNGPSLNFTLVDDLDNSCVQNIIVDGTSF